MALRAVVFGAGGLLGRELARTLAVGANKVQALLREECDIASAAAVERAIADLAPDVLFNAAAYTDVDGAERDPRRAYAANALGPAVLAAYARAHGARLVHVSTDYVFAGDRETPYTELDRPAPRGGVYALSKLAGEEAALGSGADAIVVRTAWVFGPGGKNFVSRMPALLREGRLREAVEDQWSSPTLASDLAPKLVELALRAGGRLFHVVNPGAPSYLDVARLIASQLGLDAYAIGGVAGATLARAAPRPRYSALESLALPAEGFASLRPFEDAVEAFVKGERAPA